MYVRVQIVGYRQGGPGWVRFRIRVRVPGKNQDLTCMHALFLSVNKQFINVKL